MLFLLVMSLTNSACRNYCPRTCCYSLHHSGTPRSRLYSTIPAKTYEYIAARKPILCLSSNGAVTELISELGMGLSVDPLDFRAVRRATEEIYYNYESWQARAASARIEQFEARVLTQELVSVLQGVQRRGYG